MYCSERVRRGFGSGSEGGSERGSESGSIGFHEGSRGGSERGSAKGSERGSTEFDERSKRGSERGSESGLKERLKEGFERVRGGFERGFERGSRARRRERWWRFARGSVASSGRGRSFMGQCSGPGKQSCSSRLLEFFVVSFSPPLFLPALYYVVCAPRNSSPPSRSSRLSFPRNRNSPAGITCVPSRSSPHRLHSPDAISVFTRYVFLHPLNSPRAPHSPPRKDAFLLRGSSIITPFSIPCAYSSYFPC